MSTGFKIFKSIVPETYNEQVDILEGALTTFLNNCRSGIQEYPAQHITQFGPMKVIFDVLVEGDEPVIKTTINCNVTLHKLTDDQLNVYRKVLIGTNQQIIVDCPKDEDNKWYQYIISENKYK